MGAMCLMTFGIGRCSSESLFPFNRKKVLIDLSKDDSIYYCGLALGGTEDDGLAGTGTGSSDGQVC